MPHVPKYTSILIVADDEPTLATLQTCLEQAAYNIEVARTGADGVALTLSEQPNIVIVDSALRDLGGLRVLDIIRKTQGIENTPVVVLMPEFPEDLSNLMGGLEACVEKPLDGESVLEVVRRLLDRADEEARQYAERNSENVMASEKTILVVDDEPLIVRLVKVNLERQGYVVISASNGDDALSLIDEFEPDLLVLDDEMPGMDGEQVWAQVRNNPNTCDLPIIMLTPRTVSSGRFRNWRQDVDCYLTKPFNPMYLITFVRRIFRSIEESEQGDD